MADKPKIRFGDFVRGQLVNPDSAISLAKTKFSFWKGLAKGSPERYVITRRASDKFALIDKHGASFEGDFISVELDRSSSTNVGELMAKT